MVKDKEKFVYYFLLFLPIIDLFTSIATWEGWPSIGLVLKGFFLLFAVVFLLKKNYKKRYYWFFFFLVLLYGLLDIGYWMLQNPSNVITEITHLIKVFYLPVLVLFFGQYENKYLSKKTFFYLSCLFLLFYLVPYPFGLGHNISEVYPNKDLYLSYFYIGNELANIFIILVPVGIMYLLEVKKKVWLGIYLLFVFFMLLLLGTKTMYISVFLILIYFLLRYRKCVWKIVRKHLVLFGVVIVFGISFLGIYLPRSQFWKNIETSLNFYEVNSLRDLFTLENIDNIIYSNRLDFLGNVHEEYARGSLSVKLLGLGRTRIAEIKDIEIDLFDIFYSIGIIGFMVYVLFFGFALRQVRLTGIYLFLFILLGVISMFTGHVLISPMTSTYLALLFGVCLEERRSSCEIMDQKAT